MRSLLLLLTFILGLSTANVVLAQELKPLTAEIVEEMYKKNNDMSWNDLDGYPYTDDKNDDIDFVTRIYKLSNGHELVLGGPSFDAPPSYILISDGKANIIKTIKDNY